MNCFSELTYAIFVDGELAAEEARQVRSHLATCSRCRELVEALSAEHRVLNEVLRELPEEVDDRAGLPWFRRPWVWDLAGLAVVLALVAAAGQWLDALRVPEMLEGFNPFSAAGRLNLFFNLAYYFGHGGTAVLVDYADTVGRLSLLFLLGSGVLRLGRRWRRHQLGLCLPIVLLALSLPGFALEPRHSEFVTVAANETVDDTLVAAANTVRVDGVVNGDLLAFGRIVEVRGTVKGDLLSWAQRTEVSGTVEGHIYTFSQSFEVSGQVGHSIYAWVQTLHAGNKSHVGDGILAGAADITVEGEVTRSITIFAGSTDVSGSIGRDLTVTGGGLMLANSARVGGNLTARVHRQKDVHIADGAIIGGKRDIQMRVEKSRFVRPKFYFFQAVRLLAAMLVGWLGLVLFPGFFLGSAQAVGSGWRSFGLGSALLVGVPVAIIVGAVTLVGIPVALMLLALYLTAIYLAKVWVGAFLGRILLKSATTATTRDWLLALLVGLLIITVAGFIPYAGGLIRFGVVCLGLGAFAWQLYRTSRPATTAQHG
jgi:cytoskeletal protein CcmA (bactofilin family)